MKNYLCEKIKERKTKGEIREDKAISEKLLITEYWRFWFEIDEKDKIKKLISYPGMIKKDYDDINETVGI